MGYDVMVGWLVAGVVLFFAEMGVPGVGLMFAGFGALTVGMLLNFSLVAADDHLFQALVFVALTSVYAVVLWKPIQKLRLGKGKAQYNNIIGDVASVSEKGINKTHGGEVIWSGAIMKAKLAETVVVEKLEAGSIVVVKDIVGNTLIVAPK